MKVVASEVNGCSYLTAGKVYTVLEEHPRSHINPEQRVFDILSDDGNRIHILKNGCPHTQSDWEIITEDRMEALNELTQLDQEMGEYSTPEEEEEWKVKEEKQYDNVERPRHYQLLPGVEFKDVRRAILDKIEPGVPYTQIDDWSRVFEYVGRMWDKNGLEDAKKARVYLNWLIEKMEEKK